MKRHVTLRHIKSKSSLRPLLDELLDRLEMQSSMFDRGSVTAHVALEHNVSRALFRVSLSCAVPKKTLAVHEEGHDAVATIREAFAEVERQLKKYKAKIRHEHQWKQTIRDAGSAFEGD